MRGGSENSYWRIRLQKKKKLHTQPPYAKYITLIARSESETEVFSSPVYTLAGANV